MKIFKSLVAIFFLTLIVNSCYNKLSDNGKETLKMRKKMPTIEGISSERLRAEIDKIVFESANLKDVEIETALHYMAQRGSEQHPNHPFYIPLDYSGVVLRNDVTVTLRARNISFSELMTRVCVQGGLKWEIKKGRIAFSTS